MYVSNAMAVHINRVVNLAVMHEPAQRVYDSQI